jgi:hypothetical protein
MLAMFQDPNLGMTDVSFERASLYFMLGGVKTRPVTVIKPLLTVMPYLA